jgi:hypothetical protein
MTYSKIYSESGCNVSLDGYIREDTSKKVYFRGKGSGNDVLLYNFNISAGDSVTVNYSLSDTSRKSTYYVDSVGYDTVLGNSIFPNYDWPPLSFRKLYRLKYYSVAFYWAEGIGHMGGPLSTCGPGCIGAYDEILDFSSTGLNCPRLCVNSLERHSSPDCPVATFANPSNSMVQISISDLVWNAYNCPDGLYLLKITMDLKNRYQRIVLAR